MCASTADGEENDKNSLGAVARSSSMSESQDSRHSLASSTCIDNESARATISDSASKDSTVQSEDARLILQRGIWYAASSLWLLLVASSLTMPHQQGRRDMLACDNLCFGTLTSARSTLKLIGATLVGYLSDMKSTRFQYDARKWCLWMGLVAAGIAIVAANRAQSIPQLWLATIPLALEQNVHVLKAVLSEYHDLVPNSTSGDRASSAGKLGMAAGLAMMMGPAIGTLGVKTYGQATRLSLVFLLLACGLTARLPTVRQRKQPVAASINEASTSSSSSATTTRKRGLWKVLDIPSARSPAALVILSCRLLSTLSFYIYQTILTTSLKERFDFQPRDYGTFFSVIGLFFALSQGFVAKILLDRFGETPSRRVQLLLLCCLVVGISRYFAFYTMSRCWLYMLFSVMVTAYGVISTIFAADTSQIAAPGEVGSFFGLLAAVEQGAGMAGPLLGGALSYYVHPTRAPLLAVVGLNACTLVIIAWGYDRFVTQQVMLNEQKVKRE
ncbi:hypothetical protein MPSEU_001027000 [Mayamaea pseudoterrestris]|nr:hypothetical protein MPSEU_001027000 [Mayamaea pseudoterrestris]